MKLKLRQGPEALHGYSWTLTRPKVTCRLHRAPLGGESSSVILHQTANGTRYVVHRVEGVVPVVESELVRLQQ